MSINKPWLPILCSIFIVTAIAIAIRLNTSPQTLAERAALLNQRTHRSLPKRRFASLHSAIKLAYALPNAAFVVFEAALYPC